MKTVNVVSAAVGEGVSDDAQEMMIDENSSVFLMDALGKLYSQPARAALREYLSNGIDAHVEAGGSRPPVKVTLPDTDNLKLTIRDYGNGMSEEQFGTILRRYGASTKRNSNKLTGGFGLGAKAGFAIADEFYMTSYQNGLALRVRIFKNASGKGFIEVESREKTTEPDGMLVEVKIPSSNLKEVSLDSLEADKFFEAYKTSEIEVEGTARVRSGGYYTGSVQRMLDLEATSLHSEDNYLKLEYGGNVVGWVSKTSKGHSSGNIRAIIGRVTYSIKFDESKNRAFSEPHAYSSKFGKHLQELNELHRGIVLNLPIGSVDLPSSREELTYSERSLRTISAVAESVHRALEEAFQRDINTCETGYEALQEIISLTKDQFWKVDGLTWRGKTPPLKVSPRSYEKWAFEKGTEHIIRYTKTPDARPSLAAKSIFTTPITELSYWGLEGARGKGDREFFMVANDDDEFQLAAQKIRTTITDYRKSIITDYAPSLSITLMKADDANGFWFKHGDEITLEKFLADTKKFRSAKRAETRAAHPTATVTSTKTATRQASWISLNKTALQYWPLSVNSDDELELLDGASNFYYLSKNEATNISSSLAEITPTKRYGQTMQLHDGHKNFIIALMKILGEDANIVFLPGNRNMEDFRSTFPNVESVTTALKSKLEKEWEEVKNNGKKGSFLESMFWSVENSHRIVNIHRFAEALTDGERAGLNSDLLDLMTTLPYGTRTASNSVAILFQELLGRSARADVTQWITAKAVKVTNRYPLLTKMSLYGTEWDDIKADMLRYLKSC